MEKFVEENIKNSKTSNVSDIRFKWYHLVQQEIEMWINLCCKDKKHKQVSIDDFDWIVKRRGFNEHMVKVLINILSEIGLGKKIKEYKYE